MIHQVPEKRKEVWGSLDLVDHDHPAQVLERKLRLVKSCQIPRILQIEVEIVVELFGQSRLAALSRPQYRRDREHENSSVMFEISCF